MATCSIFANPLIDIEKGSIVLDGEDATRKVLEEFNCAKNPSIQHFARNNAPTSPCRASP